MRNLENRLRRMEGIEFGDQPACHTCALNPPGGEPVFRVAWEGEDDTPEHCPECGRKQVFTLEFDDRG